MHTQKQTPYCRGVEESSDMCSGDSVVRPSRFPVTGILPNNNDKTGLKKYFFVEFHSRRQPNSGTRDGMGCRPALNQSRRSVTEGSSSASADSILAV